MPCVPCRSVTKATGSGMVSSTGLLRGISEALNLEPEENCPSPKATSFSNQNMNVTRAKDIMSKRLRISTVHTLRETWESFSTEKSRIQYSCHRHHKPGRELRGCRHSHKSLDCSATMNPMNQLRSIISIETEKPYDYG